MQEEKLGVLIEKIPVLTVMERGKDIVSHAKNKERRENIIGSILKYLKKKKPSDAVKTFE